MSLPGFKSTIELESGPTGPVLIDRQSGHTWPISPTESQLLSLWDGQVSATSLSAKLLVEGHDVEPWQVERFFARLSHADVLSATAPVVPDFVPAAPGIEDLSDIVPTLRGDLEIDKSTGRGTLEVKDPRNGRSFTLYDFEVSIARMLDGKRTVADVMAAANRLGIPATLPTLKVFLQQLQAYQFIDHSGGGGESTWPRRRQWSEGVRELYQSALRMLRAGKFEEARGYAEAMVAGDPDNEEAVALCHRIVAEAAGPLEFSVPFDTLHTPVSSPSILPNPFLSIATQAPTVDLPPPTPGAQLPDLAPEEEPAPAPPRKRSALFVALMILATVAVLLLRPVTAVFQLPGEVQLDELALPRAPRSGPVGKPEVASGAPVAKGALLARIALDPAESPEALDARIKDVTARFAAAPPPATPKDLARAKVAAKKAGAAVAALTRKMKRASKRQLVALEQKREPQQRALDAALLTINHPDLPAELKAELEQLTSKKVAAAIQAERAVVSAPEAGLFLAPEPPPEHLAENDPFGRIVAPTFRVVTKDPLPAGAQSAVFTTPAGPAEVKLENGAARIDGQLKWIGAKGTLEVSAGLTPWIFTALRSSGQ